MEEDEKDDVNKFGSVVPSTLPVKMVNGDISLSNYTYTHKCIKKVMAYFFLVVIRLPDNFFNTLR